MLPPVRRRESGGPTPKNQLKSLNEDDEDDRREAEKVKTLYGQFKGYMTTLPVLGFNRYDMLILLKCVKSKY